MECENKFNKTKIYIFLVKIKFWQTTEPDYNLKEIDNQINW